MAVHEWHNDDGIFLTFCGCFGVAEIWQVDEADNFGSDAFQLWMASEILRDGRYLERITMLREEIGASRRERFFERFFETRAMLRDESGT